MLIRILIGLIAALLLGAIAVGLWVATFDPNAYRPQMSAWIKDQTGLDVSLEGEVELALWPQLALAVRDVGIADPSPSTSAADRLTIDHLALALRLGPLLERRVEVAGLQIEGARGTVRTHDDGTTNWDDVTDDADPASDDDGDSPAASPVAIDEITISDASIVMIDAAGEQTRVDIENARLAPVQTDSPIQIDATITAHLPATEPITAVWKSQMIVDATSAIRVDNIQTQLTGAAIGQPVDLQITTLTIPESGQALPSTPVTVRIGELMVNAEVSATADDSPTISITASTSTVPGAQWRSLITPHVQLDDAVARSLDQYQKVQAAASAQYRSDQGTVDAAEVQLSADEVTVDAQFSLDANGNAEGRIDVPEFQPGAASQTLLAAYLPEDADAAQIRRLGMRSNFVYASGNDTTSETLRLSDLTAQFGTLSLSGTLAADLTRETGSGTLNLAPFSPRDLMRMADVELETADAAALSSAQGRFDLFYDPERVRLANIQAQFDGNPVTGTVELIGESDVAFDITLDELDLDKYLAPDDEAEDQNVMAVELPTESVRDKSIEGRLRAARIRTQGFEIANVTLRIVIRDGIATIDDVSAELYGGTFNGRARLDGRNTGALAVSGNVKAVQIGDLQQAATGERNTEGIAALTFDVSGTGDTLDKALSTANGNFQMQLAQGALNGFNLGHKLCAAYNQVRRLPAPAAPENQRTPIDRVTFSGNIVDGVVRSDDLDATNTYLKANGNGRVRLARQSVDYGLTATLAGVLGIEGCADLERYIGRSFPLKITGSMLDPTVRPDFGKILQTVVRDKIQEKIQDKLFGKPKPVPPAGDESSAAPTESAPAADEAPRSLEDVLGERLGDRLRGILTPKSERKSDPDS